MLTTHSKWGMLEKIVMVEFIFLYVGKQHVAIKYLIMNPIVRYADDFVLVAKDKEQAEEMKTYAKTALKSIGLEDEKTCITEIDFDLSGNIMKPYLLNR